eukprot:3040998-Rhodomonas_salina.1
MHTHAHPLAGIIASSDLLHSLCLCLRLALLSSSASALRPSIRSSSLSSSSRHPSVSVLVQCRSPISSSICCCLYLGRAQRGGGGCRGGSSSCGLVAG